MPLIYEDQFNVFQFECDPWDRMTPGAILRRVQEIGTMQTEELGLTPEMYKKTHTAFLLSRISLEIYNCPTLKQNIRIETRAYGIYRAVYQRVTTLYDATTGEKLCEADSRWILVDTQVKRILRHEPEGFISPFAPMNTWGEQTHEMYEKVKIETTETVLKQTACYSLCDKNGHINNTKYADIVCDVLPLEKLQERMLKKLVLLYKAEIQMGQEFTVSLGLQQEDNKELYYFLAKANEQKNFEAYVEF